MVSEPRKKLVISLWELDRIVDFKNEIFQKIPEILNDLLDPSVLPLLTTSLQLKVLQVLFDLSLYSFALEFLRGSGVSSATEETIFLKLNILLKNDLLQEAFSFIVSYSLRFVILRQKHLILHEKHLICYLSQRSSAKTGTSCTESLLQKLLHRLFVTCFESKFSQCFKFCR